jgi:hypothetical protein
MGGDRFPSTGKPKFVMVGIDRPGGGVRLYASRDIPERELRWGLATGRYGDATGWHIDAEMRRTLVTDADTWGQAFGRVFEIWENHDREAAQAEIEDSRRLRIGDSRRKAADHRYEVDGRPAHVAIDGPGPMRGGIEALWPRAARSPTAATPASAPGTAATLPAPTTGRPARSTGGERREPQGRHPPRRGRDPGPRRRPR